MKLLVKMKFGSHLYGTDTPDSDTDYKGVYLPTKEDCFLNNIEKSINSTTGNDNSKNSKDDIDEEYYSIQYFMKLAKQGEMIVLDMLHAPDSMILETSPEWEMIRANRDAFYSKNLAGYLGYIRKQCAKYGIKGSRIAAMKEVKNILEPHRGYKPLCKLQEIWHKLPVNEHCMYTTNPKEDRFRMYTCCGKQVQETVTVEYFLDIIDKTLATYGARALQAEKNEGIDWKAVSHAYRAGLQLEEIYKTGDLVYPLAKAEEIKNMKVGNLHFMKDKVQDKLEVLLQSVEALSKESDYPDSISEDNLNNIILNIYKG